ncbi:helix-turn-helix domain-containing GNAT family N-acetyltransferase [Rhizobium sp. BK251]|uniref:bifunctional helix-turn-helix transcriptional regulator/GNAT family N-acetyltransferase n=1 Tax=Rhizobium sp. BK251 TaxID=2512125 RepID=UPI001049A006|nr:helix-turn-helix domain-containing GNAT family N-acetyltransferase [Rhizobium sp. BK251]TCL73798.1 MarR family transcriptional regulator with acetyltransferase activity [Rhizobium sp. BK251]
MSSVSREALIDAVRDFNRFYTNWLGVLDRAYLASPYTLTEARALFEIGTHDTTAAVDLARELHVDPAYLSRILKRFRGEGLIDTRQDQADRRSQVISITQKGHTLLDELARRSRERIAEQFADLPPGAPARIVDAMDNIRLAIDPGRDALRPAILRPHRAGDIGWIISSQSEFYTSEFGWDLRFEGLIAEVAGHFLANFDRDREYCWIAERDGINVGSALVANGGGGVARLRLLYVDKAAGGLGIGTLLVNECIGFARRAGYSQLSLWTDEALTTARNIYARAGFRLVSRETQVLFGAPMNGETWVLDL